MDVLKKVDNELRKIQTEPNCFFSSLTPVMIRRPN